MREIPTGPGRMSSKYMPGMNLSQEIEHDKAIWHGKRGEPSMPKLEFMNGTKWGKDPGDDDPAWPRAA